MRTTITLEPDVDALLRLAMREQRAPFKRVLNDALRRGLQPQALLPTSSYVPMSFDLGRALVDVTNMNALADELEDQALIEKLRAGR